MPKRQHNYRWKDEIIRIKREAAEKRAEEYAKRSVQEQLALLDTRPGNSIKERAKLELKLQ